MVTTAFWRLQRPLDILIGMSDVTRILSQIDSGDPHAAEQLLPLVYDELRRLAATQLAQEKPGQTLQATALVHEAYLRLLGPTREAEPQCNDDSHAGSRREGRVNWDSRGHFFVAAAQAMRRILVDRARRKQRVKHGGLVQRVELHDVPSEQESELLLALDQALTHLAVEDAVAARVVELRHFAGLSHEGVAESLQITVYQARQKWSYARAWLQNALSEE